MYSKENKDSCYMYDSSEKICNIDMRYYKYYISIVSKDPRYKSDLYTFGSSEKPKHYLKTKKVKCIDINDLLKQTPVKNHELLSLYKKIYLLFENKEGQKYIAKVNYLGTVKDVLVGFHH